jgi:hypothetical protein
MGMALHIDMDAIVEVTLTAKGKRVIAKRRCKQMENDSAERNKERLQTGYEQSLPKNFDYLIPDDHGRIKLTLWELFYVFARYRILTMINDDIGVIIKN